MIRLQFEITGMTCSACVAHVEKAVRQLPGVTEAAASLLTNRLQITYDPTQTRETDIMHAVEQAGYGIRAPMAPRQAVPTLPDTRQTLRSLRARLLISFALLLPLMYLSMGHMMRWPLPAFLHDPAHAVTFALTQFLLTLPIVWVNRTYYTQGFRRLLHGQPNMDSLIAVGSGAALVYGVFALYQIGYGLGQQDLPRVSHYMMDLYFESAAMILTLITLGKYLELRSRGKTSEAIAKLMRLTPKTAWVLRDGAEMEVPVEEMVVGDLFLVKPGQSVPVDGVIVSGHTALDESALTGESMPVEKGAGAQVIAATLNKTGAIRCRAEKVGEDTTLAQIIRLVADAAATKAPIAKLADQVSAVFVPIVMIVALVAFCVWLFVGKPFDFALSIGIAVLVISCPCALGLATPVAIMVGTGKAAEYGVLMKSAEALEILHTVQTIVLDKTGTVTTGKPQVTDLLPIAGTNADALLRLAASLEAGSEHPLAEAIMERARASSIMLEEATDFHAEPGLGVTALMHGRRFFAGNLRYLAQQGLVLDDVAAQGEALALQGKTPLYFAAETQFLGLLGVADVVKPTSAQAIDALLARGLDVVLLTGDHQQAAEAVRAQLRIPRVIAEVLPEDKEREIRALQAEGKRVAMVGDGINDAPALASADVGIAIGAGTDIAMESADIVLMKNDLNDVVTALDLSRAVIRNVKENLFWAFFYNAIGIPLAAGVGYTLLGWRLNPMFGAAAMSLSSVCVVANALRLRTFRPSDRPSDRKKKKKHASKQGGSTMVRIMQLDGLHCMHCVDRVQKTLQALEGVQVQIDLASQEATLRLTRDIPNETLRKAVEDAGYTVRSIR